MIPFRSRIVSNLILIFLIKNSRKIQKWVNAQNCIFKEEVLASNMINNLKNDDK
jgi:hypothetical protein